MTTMTDTQRRQLIEARQAKRQARRRVEPIPQYVEFGAHLLELIAASRWGTITSFAGQLKGQDGGPMHPSMITKITRGMVPPPAHSTGLRGSNNGKGVRAAASWAKLLGLRGERAREFDLSVWITRSSTPVWKYIKELEAAAMADRRQ